MKLTHIRAVVFAFVFVAGAVFAAETKKEVAAAKVANCCAAATKEGKTCGHACCVDAAKAGLNCEKCGGAGALAVPEKKK